MPRWTRHHVNRAWSSVQSEAIPFCAHLSPEAELARRSKRQAENLIEMRPPADCLQIDRTEKAARAISKHVRLILVRTPATRILTRTATPPVTGGHRQ